MILQEIWERYHQLRIKKTQPQCQRSYQPQKPTGGKSALDIVKADIRKKYGKDAIMDVGKKIMPALSKKQQKFFGIVRAIQKGEQTPTTPETAKAFSQI